MGSSRLDVKREILGMKPENESIDARNCGGVVRTSVEIFVIKMEQRGNVE
jgi:hypothetical protein